jgi:hypothetical protein
LWLITPDEPEIAASVRWPDDDGAWLITAHWAKVDDRPAIVGLDVRSYVDTDQLQDGSMMRYPVADDLAEVTQAVLRSIPISQIRDRTREQLIRASESVLFTTAPEVAAEHGDWAAERLATLTAKGEPRKRRPTANEDLLRHVAALYSRAVGQGDKAPAKYVAEQLSVEGEPRLSTTGGRVLVRQWIRRARERGYLPTKGEK